MGVNFLGQFIFSLSMPEDPPQMVIYDNFQVGQ